jgi:hypothetical protein
MRAGGQVGRGQVDDPRRHPHAVVQRVVDVASTGAHPVGSGWGGRSALVAAGADRGGALVARLVVQAGATHARRTGLCLLHDGGRRLSRG